MFRILLFFGDELLKFLVLLVCFLMIVFGLMGGVFCDVFGEVFVDVLLFLIFLILIVLVFFFCFVEVVLIDILEIVFFKDVNNLLYICICFV